MSPLGNSCEIWLQDGLWYWEIIDGASSYIGKRGFKQRQDAEDDMQREREYLEDES